MLETNRKGSKIGKQHAVGGSWFRKEKIVSELSNHSLSKGWSESIRFGSESFTPHYPRVSWRSVSPVIRGRHPAALCLLLVSSFGRLGRSRYITSQVRRVASCRMRGKCFSRRGEPESPAGSLVGCHVIGIHAVWKMTLQPRHGRAECTGKNFAVHLRRICR